MPPRRILGPALNSQDGETIDIDIGADSESDLLDVDNPSLHVAVQGLFFPPLLVILGQSSLTILMLQENLGSNRL
jgi:hypothetical protein